MKNRNPQCFRRPLGFSLTLLAWSVAWLLSLWAPSHGADAMFPPALKVGMVPPPGFVLGENFQGFRHNEKQAQIALAELPGYAFEGLEKQVSGEAAANPSAQVRRDFPLNEGGRAFLITATRTSPQGPVLQWTLVANLRDTTAVVTALVPEAIKEVASAEAMEKSLATLTVRASVPLEEQLSVLPFAMNELAGYRIVRVQPGIAAMLTDGPKDAIESTEQPLLLISIAPARAQPRPEEREGLARRLISDIPGVKEVRAVRSEPLRIAGQQGHELLLEAKDAKQEVDLSVVQWLRFGSGTILRIVGIARKEVWEEHYPRFRRLRDGIGPK